MEHRPNPEKLLKRIEEEERAQKRGKLKIYLGAAPGVGKTYAMLQDAFNMRKQGLDVVIGIVESHGRKEIEQLLTDFEILPRQVVLYHNKELLEFDIDAVFKRNPGLVLIDEMAHTNAPGLRHSKRWQDIKELLDRGIDVYTTLNVQHIESLNDAISQIIHARVKETVPDFMIEMANIIELIDLPPEDLLKRLQEGKVYFPAQAALAMDKFFRKGNLSALRELALRITAERVGEQVLFYRQGQGIKHIWPTKTKLLVCVGPYPESAKIVRSACRLAKNLQAEWVAIYVEVPKLRQSIGEDNYAISALRLAEQLGADTQVLNGFDIVKTIMDFAREQNISQIVIGKRTRSRWLNILFNSTADEIVRQSGEIDVYIITGDVGYVKPVAITTKINPASSWKYYLISIGIIGLATMINMLLDPLLHHSNLIMVYLLGITIVALLGRVGPSLLASILSVLAYKFFFVPPFFTFIVTDIPYFINLVVMLLVAYVISHLTIISTRQAELSHRTMQRTTILHTLSRQLASTRGIEKLLNTATHYLGDVFNSDVLVLLYEDNRLVVKAVYRTILELSEKEQGVAKWVHELGQIAGLGTDTLPFSDSLYIPLLASQGSIGVLRLHPLNQERQLFTPEQMHLLEACANQIALAIEVDYMQEQMKKTEVQSETDRHSANLLRAVSYDLRAPLVAVMSYVSTLIEMNTKLDEEMVKKMGRIIYTELEELNRLTNNLLQISYLEAESVKLQMQPHAIQEVIDTLLETFKKKTQKKEIRVTIPAELPDALIDLTLMQEVFVNLVDNAIKFTPIESPIDLNVIKQSDSILISIEDRGPGVVPDETKKLFEKFYRGRLLKTERGLGLGLAICRNIIKAHGGTIWVENREGGGAAFRFTVPIA